ncbi:MAG: cadherin-like beta sandwich domain-containing protein [Chitinispirillaceae bacterium]|nr:cadherin-like beta sandwich domain-containing protein [Chitinispirillaceae bacterium]
MNVCKAVFIFLYMVSIVFADGGTSTEDVNPFNEFMQPSGGVNLFSGDAGFPFPVYSLSGRNGMNVDIKFQYSSNIYAKVRARNDIAPTGVIGLGWAFGVGKVVSEHNNTAKYDDDTYYWQSPEGLQKKLFVKSGNSFYIEDMPYWKVERKVADGLVTGWEFTDKGGKKYFYGNPGGAFSTNKATRYTIYCATSGYVGPNLSACAELYPYIWDLACVSDLFNNKVHYTYEQKSERFDPTMDLYYTRASYIKEIKNPQGDKIEFTYKEKDDPREYYGYHSRYQKASRYVDVFEKEYLSEMLVTVQNNAQRKYTFGYKVISLIDDTKNSKTPELRDCFAKRLLTSIKEYTFDAGKQKLLNATGFSYYEDKKVKGSAASINKQKENYNFGALKEILLPRCGKISYEYEKQELTLSSKGMFSSVDPEIKEIVDNAEYVAGGVTEDGIDFAVLAYEKTATDIKLLIVYWDGIEWRKQKLNVSTDDKYLKAFTGSNYIVLITKQNISTDTYRFGFNFCSYSSKNKEFIIKNESIANSYQIGTYISEPKVLISGDNVLVTDLIENYNDITYSRIIGSIGVNFAPYTANVRTKLFSYNKNSNSWSNTINRLDLLCFGEFDGPSDLWKDRKTYRYDFILGNNYLIKCKFAGNGEDYITQIEESNFSVTKSFEECCEDNDVFRWADQFKDLEVFRFDGTSWNSQSYSFHQLGGRRVFVGEDYFVIYYKPGTWANEIAYIYRWDGDSWASERHEIIHAKNFEVTTGHDFFAIDRPITNNLDLFSWNGENWNKQVDREYYNKNIDFKTGNDFLTLRYANHSFGRGKNWHLKENFKVWNKFKNKLDFTHGSNIGLGKKIEKTFDVGRDFIVASRNKDQNRNAVHDLTFNALKFNGLNWETEKIYSEFTKNKEEMKDPQPNAFGQSFYIKKNAGNTKELLFYKKFQNSFSEPIFVYSVTNKKIYDGLHTDPMVINYDYNIDGNCYYNLQAGTAEFEKVTVTDGSGGSTVYKFICGANIVDGLGNITYNRRVLEGQLEQKTILDKTGGVVSNEKYSYGIVDNTDVNEWPSEMYYTYNSKIEKTNFGIVQTVENTIDLANGEIKESKETGGSRQLITKNIYPSDISSLIIPEYEKMMEKNIIGSPLQTTIYSTNTDPGNAVSSSVNTWKINNDIVVPDATYSWKTKSGVSTYSDYDFDVETMNTTYVKRSEIVCRTAFGQVTEEKLAMNKSKSKYLSTANFYGHQSCLPIATAKGAHYTECAFLTGDYSDALVADGVEYIDGEQQWVNGNAAIVLPVIQHFGEQVLALKNAKYIQKKIAGANLKGDYIFSAWCVASGTGTGHKIHLDALKGTSNDDITGSLKTGAFDVVNGEWKKVFRVITAEQIKTLPAGSDLTLKITAETGTEINVEDVRFYPKSALVKTYFYDPRWKSKTAEVDENNNPSNITEYDTFGFVERTKKRSATGVETPIQTFSRTYMNCFPEESPKLGYIIVNTSVVKIENGVPSYINLNGSKSAKVVATAENLNSTIAINGDVSNEHTTSKEIELASGANGPVVVSVIEPNGDLSTPGTYKDYYLYINNPRLCANLQKEGIVDAYSNSIVLTEFNGLLTIIAAEPARVTIKQLSSGIWQDIHNLTGIYSKVKATVYNSNLFIGMLDEENAGKLKMYQITGATITDITSDISTASIVDFSLTTNASGDIVAGFIADEAEELTGTAGDELVEKAFVKVYNGAQWGALGADHGKVSEAVTNEISLGRNSSGIICSYLINDELQDGIGIKNFASGTWNAYAGGTVTNAAVTNHAMKIDQSGKVFVSFIAYGDFFTETGFNRLDGVSALRVKTLQSGVWVDAQSGKENICYINDKDKYGFHVINSIPFLFFSNESNENAVTIIKLANTGWEPVGNYTALKMGSTIQAFYNSGSSTKYIVHKNENSGQFDLVEDAGSCGNVFLENLQVMQNTANVVLYPAFNSYTYNYDLIANSAQPTLTISGVANGSNVISIDGDQVTNKSIYIDGDSKKIQIVATSPDNLVSTTYTLTVTKSKSSFVSLCGFEIIDNNGAALGFSPAFFPATHNYTVNSLSSAQRSVRIKPLVNGNYNVLVNNLKAPGNKFSSPVGLEYGNNSVTLAIYAEDKVTKSEYNIEFNRAAPSDVKLNTLSLAGLTLDKTFSSNEFSYVGTAANTQQTFSFSATTTAQSIEYWYNDNVTGQLSSGENSGPIGLSESISFLKLKVHGTGLETAKYLFKLQKEPANNVKLNAINIYDPANNRIGINSYNPNITEYSISVPFSIDNLKIAPQKADATSKLYYCENEMTTSDITGAIDIGDNTFKFDVVSQDETSRASYKIFVLRNQDIPLSKTSIAINTLSGMEDKVKNVPIRISRSYSLNSVESFTYSVTGGTATNGTDFILNPAGSITLDLCDEFKDVYINIIDDAAAENDETIQISFYNSSGTMIDRVNYTILDDDKDNTVPNVTITTPTPNYYFWTPSAVISISGTANDNDGINRVTYTLTGATTGSGNATGTTSWNIAPLSINMGFTTITVTATDNIGNVSSDILNVTRSAETGIRYVRANNGTSGDGHSWVSAYNRLQDALEEVHTIGSVVTEIRVAAGTYYADNGTGLKDKYFDIYPASPNVKVIGGFPADGGDVSQRNWRINQTILSGDLGDKDPNTKDVWDVRADGTYEIRNNEDNSNLVVKVTSVGIDDLLDGFIITGGTGTTHESGGLQYTRAGMATIYTIKNCRFIMNTGLDGGGAECSRETVIENCEFIQNIAYQYGGGLYSLLGNMSVRNCLFHHNFAGLLGGGIFLGAAEIINSTITENKAYLTGGGVCNSLCEGFGTNSLKNCIVFNNFSTVNTINLHDEFFNMYPYIDDTPIYQLRLKNCDIQYVNDYDLSYQVNCFGVFPDLNTLYGLNAGSICVDRGNSTFVPPGIVEDLYGNSRFVDGDGNGSIRVDIGAVEKQ